MKTILISVAENKENLFLGLFKEMHVKHKVLSEEEKEDIILARLIDEGMKEEGEVPAEKIHKFVKKYGKQV